MTLPSIGTPATCKKNWIIWLGSGLVIGGLAFWLMYKVADDPYFLVSDTQQEKQSQKK